MTILSKHTVLVVDDGLSERELLEHHLRANGYETAVAADGQEALERAARQEFEVVLLDINMPGMSGIDVLVRLHEDYPDTCVIMVTVVADVDTAVEAMKLGAYDYVTKSFNLDDVLLRVEKAVERRRLVLREQKYQRDLEREVKEKTDRLNEQFVELISGLAREHTMALELEALRKAKRDKGLFASLPPELQQPKASVEEFAQALLQLLRSGRLPRE